MAQTIKLKRSATTGNAPTTSQLALGELGINTTDGKLFLKKSVSGTESIVEVGGLPLSGGTLTGNLSLGDNVKLQLGNQTNGDLQIYHDGSASYIKENGTGDLIIQGSNTMRLQGSSNQELANFSTGGAVTLFNNGSAKLETTSTGTLTTGDVVNTGGLYSNVNNSLKIIGGGNASNAGSNLTLYGGTNASAGTFRFRNGTSVLTTITPTGIDVTGSVTADGLTVNGGGNRSYFNLSHLRLSDGYKLEWGGGTNYIIGSNASNYVKIATNSAEALTINSSQNVNIPNGSLMIGATTAPSFTTGSGIEIKKNGAATLRLHDEGSGGKVFEISSNDNEGYVLAGYGSGMPMILKTASTTALTLDTSQNATFTGSVSATGNSVFTGNTNVTGSSTIGSTAAPLRTLDSRGSGMAIFGTGSYTEIMLRERSGTTRNVGAWHWSVRGDVGGNNDDLKLLRFTSGSYQGVAMQVASATGNATFTGDVISQSSLQILKQSAGAASVLLQRSGATNPWRLAQGHTATNYFEIMEGSTSRFTIANGGNATFSGSVTSTGNTTIKDAGVVRLKAAPSGSLYGGGFDVFSVTGSNTSPYTSTTRFGNYGQNEVMVLTGANVNIPNGKLGIGFTTAPSFDLDILDTSTASNTGAGVNIAHATQPQLRFTQTSGNYRMYLGIRTNDLIIANDSGAEKVRFEQNGNATFSGDLSVTSKLTLTKAPVGTYSIEVDGTNTGQPNLIVKQSTSERLRIDNLGRVGIGTSAPAAGIHLTKSSSSNYLRMDDGSNCLINFSADTNTAIMQVQGTGFSSWKPLELRANYLVFKPNNTETMRLTSTGLGIGNSNPQGRLHLNDSGTSIPTSGYGTGMMVSRTDGLMGTMFGFLNSPQSGYLQAANFTNTDTLPFLINPRGGSVGIGTSSPALSTSWNTVLHVKSAALGAELRLADSDSGGTGDVGLIVGQYGNNSYIMNKDGGTINFWTGANGGTERARLTSGGDLLVGTTDTTLWNDNADNYGHNILSNGQYYSSTNGEINAYLNRQNSDGAILAFAQNGTTVGSIGVIHGNNLFIGAPSHSGLQFGGSIIYPTNGSNGNATNGVVDLGGTSTRFKDLFLAGSVNIGDAKTVGHGAISLKYDLVYMTAGVISPADDDGTDNDNSVDLGKSAARFNDIFATNGTIQTSDRNEKQDIESLTEAEERVAIAAKGLLKKFRWKNAVEDKGDDARIHFGIIAQDLQDAFEAEGLDAGRYGMFTSNTWTNEDGEEQTRMGVRYSELLAFIISAI